MNNFVFSISESREKISSNCLYDIEVPSSLLAEYEGRVTETYILYSVTFDRSLENRLITSCPYVLFEEFSVIGNTGWKLLNTNFIFISTLIILPIFFKVNIDFRLA